MSIVKVIEVISEGKTIDEAIANAVKEASLTLEGILQVNVKYIQAIVEKNKVVKIRVNSDISFLVDHNK